MISIESDIETIECGAEAAKRFAFEDGYINLNHGSYGTYPVEIRSVLRRYQERAEARPDTFVRYEYRTYLLDESRNAIATYLGVPIETCVLSPNASTAIDTVLRNLVFEHGDVIVCFSTVYPAFENTATFLSETQPVEICKVEYTLPVSDTFICNAFEAALQIFKAQGKKAKVALFDTVNSLPGVRMPFERLTEICRMHGVLSCIDGAHGVGQFPLQLPDLDPDFFVSNCHKWLHVPRGCAVLYVPLRNQHLMRATLPTGFAFHPKARNEADNFVANFAALATSDDTPYLCIPAALQWRAAVTWGKLKGEKAIMRYTTDLARTGGQLAATILGTEVMENDDGTLGRCAMTNVRLPLSLDESVTSNPANLELIASRIGKVMNLEHDIAVNVFAYGGRCWVRMSAQIYIGLRDFEKAAEKLRDVCKKSVFE